MFISCKESYPFCSPILLQRGFTRHRQRQPKPRKLCNKSQKRPQKSYVPGFCPLPHSCLPIFVFFLQLIFSIFTYISTLVNVRAMFMEMDGSLNALEIEKEVRGNLSKVREFPLIQPPKQVFPLEYPLEYFFCFK